MDELQEYRLSYPDPTVLADQVARKLIYDMIFYEYLKPAYGLLPKLERDSDILIDYTEVDWTMQCIQDLRRPMLMAF